MPRPKSLIVVTKVSTREHERMLREQEAQAAARAAVAADPVLGLAVGLASGDPAAFPPPPERPAVKAGREATPRAISAPRGSKEAGEALLRETAEHLDRIFPLEQRNELLAELAVLPSGTPEDQISARLNCVKYANAISGIVTVVEAKAAEAGALLPVIRAAGPPSDEPWQAPKAETPLEAARAVVAQARPMDGWAPQKPQPKPLVGAVSVATNGNGDHA